MYIFFFRLFCIAGYYKKLNYSFFKFIFNWKTIALQCCVSFWYTTTWVSRKRTYIPFLLNLLPTPHPTSLGHHTALGWAPYVIQLPTSYLFTHGNTCISMLLFHFVPTPPSPTVYTSPFSISAPHSCSVNRFISTVYMYTLIHNISFSFYGWVVIHRQYAPHLLYPFIHWWTFRLLPCPGYCK